MDSRPAAVGASSAFVGTEGRGSAIIANTPPKRTRDVRICVTCQKQAFSVDLNCFQGQNLNNKVKIAKIRECIKGKLLEPDSRYKHGTGKSDCPWKDDHLGVKLPTV